MNQHGQLGDSMTVFMCSVRNDPGKTTRARQ